MPAGAGVNLRTLWILLAVLTPWAEPSPAEGQAPALPQMYERTLDNGLTVLVLPRPGAPTAALTVQYRVGGVDERPGETGIAHLLEHLLFKGTEAVGTRDPVAERTWLHRVDATWDSIAALRESGPPDPDGVSELMDRLKAREDSARALVIPNQFDRILSRNGARGLNAMTTAETTTYFVELPSNRLELWFALEGDRMANPVFREFFTERDVVLEERRLRVDSDPAGRLYEAHMREAFRVHPYGQPVVGTTADLEGLTRPQVDSYYRRFYGATNAVVTIVGNVDPDSAMVWAERYLSEIPSGQAVAAVGRTEPPQTGERRIELALDAQPSLRIGWHAVEAGHRDAPALSMAAAILTGGRASRLQRRLVQQDRLAASVSSSVQPGTLFPGLFTIAALPSAPHTPDDVEAVIYQELARLAATPPEDSELDRVRSQIEATRVRRLRTHLGLALQLADAHSLRGDWRWAFWALEALIDVTPADVQRVVQVYLSEENRTVGTVTTATSGGPS